MVRAGDRGTGILYAFRGAGIVLGPFLVRPFIRQDDMRTVFCGIGVAFVVFAASYAVVPWMPAIWVAGLFGDTVEWRGQKMRLSADGKIRNKST